MNNRNTSFELDGYRDFMFLSHITGEPLYQSNVRRQIRDIKNMNKIKVDLPDDLSPHTLRHVFITRMAETGCDIKSLMEVSGHSKLETIMKVYNHVDKERRKRDLSKAYETREILRRKYS